VVGRARDARKRIRAAVRIDSDGAGGVLTMAAAFARSVPTTTERSRPSGIREDPTHHPSDVTLSPLTARQDSPSKRKCSEPTGTGTDNHHDPGSKKKRRKVNHACVYCRRSHMTCDLERPCARCVKRDIGHLCHDEPREVQKRSKSEGSGGVADIAPAPDDGRAPDGTETAGGGGGDGSGIGMDGSGDALRYGGQPPHHGGGDDNMSGLSGGAVDTAGVQQIAQPKPISPTQLHRSSLNTSGAGGTTAANPSMLQSFDWNNLSIQNQFQDVHHLHPSYMFNTSEVSNEYDLLNDFLTSSLVDEGAVFTSDDAQAVFNDPLLAASAMNTYANTVQQQQTQNPNANASIASMRQSQQLHAPLPPALLAPQNTNSKVAGEEIFRPSSAFPVSDKARDKFYLTAADPAGLDSASNRLHKLLKAKYDAGMLKPFNYVSGYARLQKYMMSHLHPANQRRILDQLARFRPKFREAMQSLTDMQLVLVEMWFERSLMEYDRVFASMAIPACCWRRTGEIFRGNREMAELIRVPMERLRDGRLAIHEIIAEESLAAYWEKFGAIAFDQSQKAILTSCVLKSPDPEEAGEGRKTGSGGGGGAAGGGHGGGGGGGEEEDKRRVGREKEKEERVRCCFSFTIRRDTHNM